MSLFDTVYTSSSFEIAAMFWVDLHDIIENVEDRLVSDVLFASETKKIDEVLTCGITSPFFIISWE